jgi:cytochrome b
MPQETRVPIKVWDLPIRLFHWAIVLLLVFQFVTGKIGGGMMTWHVYSGYTILALVVFRILWGFTGSTHARFASFIAGPAACVRFLRRLFSRQAVPQVGHNPVGGWNVIILVASLALQAVSGLFANDGAETEGPLARLVPFELSGQITELHRWNFNLLLVLSALHVAAVLFHWLYKKEDLIQAMFTGVKHVPESVLHERRVGPRDKPPRRVASREPSQVFFPPARRSILVLALAILITYVVVRAPV